MSLVNRNRARGKENEKALAEIIPNAKRIGVLGAEDLMHPTYSFEAKSCKAFVGSGWMEQCVRNMPKGRIPAVIVHVRGTRHNNDFVMLRLSDWLKEEDNGL
jgi:hypothetical protein